MDKSIPAGAALLLDFTRKTETGTDGPQSYVTIYGHNQGKLAKPVTAMTLAQVQAAQGSWSKRFGSSATGGYQFMKATLAGLIKELQLSKSQLLDEDLQDRLGYHLLKRRGWLEFAAGEISATEFGKRLAMEWASFPVLETTRGAHRQVKRGQSYYVGDGVNKALVAPELVESMIEQAKRLASAPPVTVEVPVVADPGELETPPAKSKTVWTWALAGIGSIATLAGDFVGGLHWSAQLAITGATVGFAIYGIKRRADLFKAVRDLKSELG